METNKYYIQKTVQEAEEVFWAHIAESFPNIKTGDLSIEDTMRLNNTMEEVVTNWINLNK